jgi:hypothetical protein
MGDGTYLEYWVKSRAPAVSSSRAFIASAAGAKQRVRGCCASLAAA